MGAGRLVWSLFIALVASVLVYVAWSSVSQVNSHSPETTANSTPFVVSWNAPILSKSSGYGSEAMSFLFGLNTTLATDPRWKLAAGVGHGDSIDYEYFSTLPSEVATMLQQLHSQQESALDPSRTIVICHSEPGAWSVPDPMYESPHACPPGRKDNWFKTIGRTMFETDRLPSGWKDRLNKMDEVWVPTRHHQRIFRDAGVTTPVVVLGQGIDVHFWKPLPTSNAKLDWDRIDPHGACQESDFKFLSVFKWENRKGPDVLLPSFWRAFPDETMGACLIIVTSLYHDDANRVLDQVEQYWHQSPSMKQRESTEPIHPKGVILLSGLPLEILVRLYQTVDAFVLPTRGEGWGRPYMEAMSVGLPVIATNWSGPTEFVDDTNGYLLPIAGLVDAQLDAFPGHKWAEPDADELVHLLRHVRNNPDEAKTKGLKAREHIVNRWSTEAMAAEVTRHLDRLREASVNGRPPTNAAEL